MLRSRKELPDAVKSRRARKVDGMERWELNPGICSHWCFLPAADSCLCYLKTSADGNSCQTMKVGIDDR